MHSGGSATKKVNPRIPSLQPSYRIIKWFVLEGTLRIIQFHPFLQPVGTSSARVRAPSVLALYIYRDGASTTPLENLPQCFNILIIKKPFFLIPNLYLSSLSFKPLPSVLLEQTLLKSLSPSFL